MAWVKIPPEHHPLFLAAVPKGPGITTLKMFGGLAALVNGNMACGLFGRSLMARLDSKGYAEVLAMEGGGPFDPMGNGRTMKDTVMMPEGVVDDADELRRWVERSIAFTRTLPPKKGKPAPKAATTRPRKKR